MKNLFISLGVFLLFPLSTLAQPFSDVPDTHTFANAIGFVRYFGIVEGYENPDDRDGKPLFKPENEINRAEFTKIIISSLYGDEEIKGCDPSEYSLSDVYLSDWFAQYVCLAKKEGIINGYADGTFQAANPITIAEAMKILLEANQLDTRVYENENQNVQWTAKWMSAFGEIFKDKKLENINSVEHKITRGEMAYFIQKLEYLALPEVEKPIKTDLENLQGGEMQKKETVVVFNTTSGTIALRLFPEIAPKAVENFITLSEEGYYDGVIFHRVIENFMVQTGDPTGTGKGGESIWDEAFEDEFSDDVVHKRGAISMANAGPGTNGSQFFINTVDNNFLDNKHTVFGEVISGINIADVISELPNTIEDKPIRDIVINSVHVMSYLEYKKNYIKNVPLSFTEKEERKSGYFWPVAINGIISQGFHSRHKGLDVFDITRPDIVAIADGVVIQSVGGCEERSGWCNNGYGNVIVIDHGEIDGEIVKSRYAHNMFNYTQVGDEIEAGQLIAKMGNSGNVRGRTGIHIHFEIMVGENKVDPLKFL